MHWKISVDSYNFILYCIISLFDLPFISENSPTHFRAGAANIRASTLQDVLRDKRLSSHVCSYARPSQCCRKTTYDVSQSQGFTTIISFLMQSSNSFVTKKQKPTHFLITVCSKNNGLFNRIHSAEEKCDRKVKTLMYICQANYCRI